MAILVSVSNLSKSFAARPLFEKITFAIESNERIGLIGPNGAGKSTLLRILASQTTPDQGNLSFQRGIRVGFLEQTPIFSPEATIHSTLLECISNLEDWEAEGRIQEIISKLSLGDSQIKVKTLSGGWKKRVALARELIKQPDLLLLDEPTNHLDVESILWLEEFLGNAPFATLTITHDRVFLQKISNRILELDRRNPDGLLSIKGDYATYLEVKDQMMNAQERREIILKNTLRRETEWLRQGAKARTTKQQARIQRAESLGEEVQELEYRNQSRVSRIEFQGTDKNPKKLVEAQKISLSYDGKNIFSDVSLLLTPGKRVGILGPNGCGKSTLVRVLTATEQPQSGSVRHSDHLSIAYFEQNRETLDPEISVLKTVCPQGDYVDYRGSKMHVRSYLDRFLFSSGQMEMAVGKLSGGEQSRLLLAKLMLIEANLLVLDEPTNDLDMVTLTVLQDCLVDFPGAVLLVTHDRYFLDQVATEILAFASHEPNTGKVVSFASLDQWEKWFLEEARKAKTLLKSSQGSTQKNSTSSPTPKKKKLSFKELKELESMEETIHRTEELLAQITEQSTLPEHAKNPIRLVEITKEMTRLQTEVDRLYARWSELEESSK